MSLADYKEVSSYYDKLWAELENQNKAGVNIRHLTILKNLKKEGLKGNSKVLEIGCGIGTLTKLIAKNLSSGKIVGVDISPETIKYNKEKTKGSRNIEFLVSDMTNFSHPDKFDFVVLPDVLEHIPVEAHDNIFKTIQKITHPGSIIFINIPHPRFVEWMHENKRTDLLQLIDQSIYTDVLAKTVYKYGFYIENLRSYSLGYNPCDYQCIVLRSKDFKINYAKRSFAQLLFDRVINFIS